mmetsp:Transcript_29996/g.75500  ORF Transcript_29996/g.75500 Transcript_29996/m.75500 type:complete len:286 (-) Transcript_29996:352-1209(-)
MQSASVTSPSWSLDSVLAPSIGKLAVLSASLSSVATTSYIPSASSYRAMVACSHLSPEPPSLESPPAPSAAGLRRTSSSAPTLYIACLTLFSGTTLLSAFGMCSFLKPKSRSAVSRNPASGSQPPPPSRDPRKASRAARDTSGLVWYMTTCSSHLTCAWLENLVLPSVDLSRDSSLRRSEGTCALPSRSLRRGQASSGTSLKSRSPSSSSGLSSSSWCLLFLFISSIFAAHSLTPLDMLSDEASSAAFVCRSISFCLFFTWPATFKSSRNSSLCPLFLSLLVEAL